MKSTDYVAYVRTLPCVICQNDAEASHLRHVGMGGDRKKENWRHFTTVPMCRLHHDEYGSSKFGFYEEVYDINLYKVALKILAQWLMEQ